MPPPDPPSQDPEPRGGPVVRYDRIVYTYHARLRMEERSISEELVADILAAPDQTYADKEELVAERVLANRNAWRVVYAEEHGADGLIVRIVSVYRIARLKAL